MVVSMNAMKMNNRKDVLKPNKYHAKFSCNMFKDRSVNKLPLINHWE